MVGGGIYEVGKGTRKKRVVGNFKIRKFPFKLESTNRSWKVFNAVLSNQNFPTSFFPISFRTFQLKNFQLLVFPTALTNYMYSVGGYGSRVTAIEGGFQNFTNVPT